MQNSTYNLPPIRAILGSSPINETVSQYGGNYSQSISPTYSSVSTDAHHLAAINSHSKLNLNALSTQHAGNTRSLISPPESPDLKSNYQSQTHYNCYGVQPRYDVLVDRYTAAPQPTQQSYEDCSCCVKQPTPIYSAPTPAYSHQYVQQSQPQRYSYAMTSPVSPYDRKSTAPSLPRLNTILEGLAHTKHFSHKSIAGPMSPTASGGNRYQCPYCSKRFSRPSSLRIHTYSHTGEKPFVCTEPGCGRKFSVQSNMRRHLRVHRLGRPVKKTRYDGEVEGYKMLSPAGILRSY